jgi:hypothetical protein
LGEVDRLPRLSPAGYAALIEANRARYCRALDGEALFGRSTARLIAKSGFELGEQEVL